MFTSVPGTLVASTRFAVVRTRLQLSLPCCADLSPDHRLTAAEYWQTNEELERMQRKIQDINVKASYDSSMTMSHALIRREMLRKQTQTLTSFLQSATRDSRYNTKDLRRVPVIDVPALKEKLSTIKKQSQQMDISIQKRNWDIDVP